MWGKSDGGEAVLSRAACVSGESDDAQPQGVAWLDAGGLEKVRVVIIVTLNVGKE